MRGGGVAHAKKPHSWRLDMPTKMRRLANRNALLAKAVDNEIKIIDTFGFDKPSTKQFASLLEALKIDRSCLIALADTRTSAARSAANIKDATVTRIEHLNVFELLNHRYLLAERGAFEAYIKTISAQANHRDTAGSQKDGE